MQAARRRLGADTEWPSRYTTQSGEISVAPKRGSRYTDSILFVYLVLLFVGLPLVELALLIEIGGRIGVPATIAVVVTTGILGAALARHQGLVTLLRFRRSLEAGQLPHRELIDGILILLAGAVLLTPGLITDLAGFLLLVPSVRRLLRRVLARWTERRFLRVPPQGDVRSDGSYDVEFTVVDREDRED